MMRPRRHTLLTSCLVLLVGGLLLACGGTALPLAHGPRWACPSPEPAAWGEDGPVKAYRAIGAPDPTTGIRAEEPIYYAEWEQEYGAGGSLLNGQPAASGPPYPSPTPYGKQGMTYSFGQRVELAPLHLTVTARSDDRQGDQQSYLLDLTWINPTSREVAFNPERQVWLRSITRPDGTLVMGDGWGISRSEAQALGLNIPSSIAPGEQRMLLPVLAPAGEPQAIEVRLPIDLTGSASETVTPPTDATPTANAELRDPAQRWLTVQWVNARPLGPACDDPGALTDWSSDDRKAIPRDAALALRAPAGAPRVVQVALSQVGKRYRWGAAGPESFDCSGLMQWSYAQIGIAIPRATANQWPRLTPVSLQAIQPGDLVFMDTRTSFGGVPQQITHVGMLADVDGDGRWDLIHAVSPRLGVRVEYNVLHSVYYAPRLFAEGRTAR